MKNIQSHFRLALFLISVLNSEGENLRSESTFNEIESEEDLLVKELSDRMKPRNFFAEADANFDIIGDTSDTAITIPPKQFFHLHHMKSGGTSLNGFLNCGLNRGRTYYANHTQPLKLTRSKLSECSYSYFKQCTTEPDNKCNSTIQNAAYMEYCAPLSAAKQFGWEGADAVTMLRHPVDRVWSMFRFQTKSCFKCTPLTEVYQTMDEMGTNASGTVFGGGVCLDQLTNHITRNLQSTIDNDDWNDHDDHFLRFMDALGNLQNSFVVVGLLERLDETQKLLAHAFPWLANSLEGSETKCNFPHSNASPLNNRCGEGNTHWDLPDQPDEETREAILKHNQLDIKLYEAATEHFELQLKAMDVMTIES